ncbi:hypothetical protein GA0070618_6676 [Micromonospora echinospora]|uniref:Uncharacterized protein n=1 Tax=Micromonospora echinospora TaxID=1877 RepID=A0A1C4U4A8_MICEC|nr:hypothetical protein [Micromonospora echinospora]SCE66553.1 hypothetical protein GA0070618_0006 [Micromonospora echinospora]SCF42549.1 hypothetical protein GA0070618_6676 [Micromonospora echinospora]
MDFFETDAVRLPAAPEGRDEYEALPFEFRDELDDAFADDLRAAVTGLPARPGTLR